MRLSAAENRLLQAMQQGQFLKSHRGIDGEKSFCLHGENDQAIPVRPQIVARLAKLGLLDSNKKFPVSTYWLTARALRLLEK
jgi:hypothetical protein